MRIVHIQLITIGFGAWELFPFRVNVLVRIQLIFSLELESTVGIGARVSESWYCK